MMRIIYSLLTIVVMVAIVYVPMAAADEWEQVLAAARKEGTVAVIGPVGGDRSAVLQEPFEKKYGIKVEYWGDRGSGALTMLNRAPHPNAAKVYINWLLSKEGQTEYAVLNGNISARLDVPTAHSPWRVPMPNAIKSYDRAAEDVKDEMVAVFKEAFGRK